MDIAGGVLLCANKKAPRPGIPGGGLVVHSLIGVTGGTTGAAGTGRR